MKLSDLKPANWNPREISDEALAGLRASLRDLGDISGFVWNKRSGCLVCGHQRLRALQDEHGTGLKMKGEKIWTPHGDPFPVRVVDWPPEKERLANMAANNPHLMGDFTEGARAVLEQIRDESPGALEDFRLDVLDEAIALLNNGPKPGKTDPDAVPDPPKKAKTKPGDLWVLGEHLVLCGSIDDEEVWARLPEHPVDAFVTDPPYSSGGMFRADRSKNPKDKYGYGDWDRSAQYAEFAGDNKDQRAFESWATRWMQRARQRAKEGATAVVFTDWRQLPTMSDALQAGGWVWRNLVTWWKAGVRMQKGRFSMSSEYMVVGSVGVPSKGENSPQNVLNIPNDPERSHLAQKPVALLAEVLGVTPAKALILDPFLGSGTTLIAAEQHGRRCFGIEIEPRYVDVAVRRWEDFTGNKARLEKPKRRARKK